MEANGKAQPMTHPPESLRERKKRETYDRIIVDSPPVNVVADTAITAQNSDAVLFVVAAQVANKQSVGSALETLARLGVRMLGTVVNRLADDDTDAYHYGYGTPPTDDVPPPRGDDESDQPDPQVHGKPADTTIG